MRFFEVHPSHRFVPDYDNDNMECFWCACRPYNEDAKKPCPEHKEG